MPASRPCRATDRRHADLGQQPRTSPLAASDAVAAIQQRRGRRALDPLSAGPSGVTSTSSPVQPRTPSRRRRRPSKRRPAARPARTARAAAARPSPVDVVPAERHAAQPKPQRRIGSRRHDDGHRPRAPLVRLRGPRAARRALPLGDARAARAELDRLDAARLRDARARGRRVLPALEGVHVPGPQDRRDLRHRRRAAGRGDPAQHPPHQRQGSRAPARARQPRLHPARGREVAARHARLPRRAVGARGGGAALRRRRRALQAVSVPGDRDRDGRTARGRRAAVGLVEPDPAPVRDEHRRGAGADRAGGDRVLRVRRRAARPPPRRPRRGPHLRPDRGGAGGRAGCPTSSS